MSNKKRSSSASISGQDGPGPKTLLHHFRLSVHEMFDLGQADTKYNLFQDGRTHALGLFLIRASWNLNCGQGDDLRGTSELLSLWFEPAVRGLRGTLFTACVEICEETKENEYNEFIEGSFTNKGDSQRTQRARIPPSELPCLALVGCQRHDDGSLTNNIRYLRKITSSRLMQQLNMSNDQQASLESSPTSIQKEVRKVVYEQEETLLFPTTESTDSQALRIFVAGDKSSVGKSSICLGLLGSFMNMGYPPESLAYIKPATQSEETQLIEVFCEKHAIKCVPIGPLVYYRGFTRAFLAGEVPESSGELLQKCGDAVDRAARGKQVVLIDGVGFPAVGSICGTSNAHVAKACGYPIVSTDNSLRRQRKAMGVLLVGGSGVGAAVDSYNLNATYFMHNHVPVLGAVFNKLSVEGFYSLENCREQVSRYFDQYQPQARPFGFVPLYPAIAKGPEAIDNVQDYIQIFQTQVDVSGIREEALRIRSRLATDLDSIVAVEAPEKASTPKTQKKARTEIEQSAILAGAAPSA